MGKKEKKEAGPMRMVNAAVAVVIALASCSFTQAVLHTAHPAAPATFDMSGMTLPVVRSLMEEQNQVQKPVDMPNTQELAEFYNWKAGGAQEEKSPGDDSLKTILPLMMMMSMRRRSYGGMGGYMGGLYGGMGGGMVGAPFAMGYPYQQAMAYPMQQAQMMYANPFLDPSKNPFAASFQPSAMAYEPRAKA